MLGFVITLTGVQGSYVIAAIVHRVRHAPSEAQMLRVTSGMSRHEVRSLLGEPDAEHPVTWYYPLPFGAGDYQSIFGSDTFQVHFAGGDRVLYAYCGD